MLTTVVHGGGEELDVEEVVAPQGALHLLNHAPVGRCLHFIIFTKHLIHDIYTYCIHTAEDTDNGKVWGYKLITLYSQKKDDIMFMILYDKKFDKPT